VCYNLNMEREQQSRLLIVSNRLPISVAKRRGRLRFEASVGGLVTALGAFYKSRPSLWIGWPGIELEKLAGEERQELEARLSSEGCQPVFLSQQDIEDYYHGFCNNTIWPLFHYFPEYAVYSASLWQAYRRVNRLFAEAVAGVARPGDIIWVQDYHLMLVPELIKERLPEMTVGFFLHIPFPSFEIFRLLPWRRQLLEGLLGAELVGFHTYDYVQHFLNSVHSLLGYESLMGQVTAADRITKADVFPLGIDYQHFYRTARSPAVRSQVSRFREKLGNRRIVLSVDRLDYTKGIPQRLEAFDLFLERHPEQREKLVLVMVVVPSRTRVEQYAQLKKRVDELVGEINGKYGSIGWTPVWYLYRSLSFDSLVALYNLADIALITPLRDGMNLIAKEYIASRTDGGGVLILSETAGVAKELGEAIVINVSNPAEIVRALEEALAMPRSEQKGRNRIMQKRLQRYHVGRWADEFIDRLLYTRQLQDEVGTRALNNEAQNRLVSDFRQSRQRLIILGYDGTLIPFSAKPEQARPGAELKRLLKRLAAEPDSEVVLVSGRDRHALERWFGGLGVGLVAEHGAWVKEKGKPWEVGGSLPQGWKEELRPLLELYVDRTPGSFVEEKEFSLVWHYRKAEPRLGELRAREVVNDLLNITANLNLQVLEGNRIVEVKNAGVNKGQAALRWVSRRGWNFILAIGDDLTDEDIFRVLPAAAWTIKVGVGASAARFSLGSPGQVVSLLTAMVKKRP
jgi:trehalose 6-phosphate synthase/phosphatase